MSGGDNCTDEEIRACLTDSGQTDARTIVKSAAAKYASVAAQLNMLYGKRRPLSRLPP
jgi:hypothetical protein